MTEHGGSSGQSGAGGSVQEENAEVQISGKDQPDQVRYLEHTCFFSYPQETGNHDGYQHDEKNQPQECEQKHSEIKKDQRPEKIYRQLYPVNARYEVHASRISVFRAGGSDEIGRDAHKKKENCPYHGKNVRRRREVRLPELKILFNGITSQKAG